MCLFHSIFFWVPLEKVTKIYPHALNCSDNGMWPCKCLWYLVVIGKSQVVFSRGDLVGHGLSVSKETAFQHLAGPLTFKNVLEVRTVSMHFLAEMLVAQTSSRGRDTGTRQVHPLLVHPPALVSACLGQMGKVLPPFSLSVLLCSCHHKTTIHPSYFLLFVPFPDFWYRYIQVIIFPAGLLC